jgi:hypothetical protein
MKIDTFFIAIKKGKSIQNKLGWKYTSLVLVISLVILSLLQSYGFLQSVTEDVFLEVVIGLIIIYLDIVTNDEIGFKDKKQNESNEKIE